MCVRIAWDECSDWSVSNCRIYYCTEYYHDCDQCDEGACPGKSQGKELFMRFVINYGKSEVASFFVFVVFSHKNLNFALSMDRIIGIDYGRKRVGVAVSDPVGIFASALETVHSAKIIEYLKSYAQKENVVRFVVGYPINMNGAPSEAAKDIDIFLKHLAKAFPEIPVTLEDERFTSVLAHRAMIDGGMKKQDRMKKESVDKISAAIILQSYMDRNK